MSEREELFLPMLADLRRYFADVGFQEHCTQQVRAQLSSKSLAVYAYARRRAAEREQWDKAKQKLRKQKVAAGVPLRGPRRPTRAQVVVIKPRQPR
jgi:hypothetical protein